MKETEKDWLPETEKRRQKEIGYWRQRQREKQTQRQETERDRLPETAKRRKRSVTGDSKLVFYAQSTAAVISESEGDWLKFIIFINDFLFLFLLKSRWRY